MYVCLPFFVFFGGGTRPSCLLCACMYVCSLCFAINSVGSFIMWWVVCFWLIFYLDSCRALTSCTYSRLLVQEFMIRIHFTRGNKKTQPSARETPVGPCRKTIKVPPVSSNMKSDYHADYGCVYSGRPGQRSMNRGSKASRRLGCDLSRT